MTTKYSIQSLAYLKIILHSAKFPSSAITGILLGYFEKDENLIIISDVIPLLHHWNDLSPIMELALQLIEIHSKSKNMLMVGLYVGNNRLEDIEIPFTSKKVADTLQKEFNKSIVLVVDSMKLSTDSPALIPYLSTSSSNWIKSTIPSTNFNLTDSTITRNAIDQIRAGKHISLNDFDEYLEDPSLDWLNNKSIAV